MATQAAFQERRGEFGRLVRRWDRRLRLRQATYWLPRALLPGLLVGILLTLISRSRPWLLPDEILLITGGLMALGLIVMLLAVALWPRPVIAAARRFDLILGLKERVSTALELIDGRIHSNDELLALQLDDAWETARKVRAGEALPLVWRRQDWGMAFLMAGLLLVLLILPNPQLEKIAQNAAQQAALDTAAEELRQITEDVAADTTLEAEDRQELLEALETTTNVLEEPNVTPEEAFAALSEVQSELQEQSEALNQQASTQQAALDAARDALRELQSDEAAQASEAGIPEMLEAMADGLPGMTPEQQQAAAEAIQQIAQSLQSSNPEAAQALQQAAQAMQNGDTGAAQQALNQAAQNLQNAQPPGEAQQASAQELSQAAQAVQQSANQVGQPGQEGQEGQPQPQPGQEGQSGDQPSQEGQMAQGGQPGQENQAGQEGQEGQGGQPGEQSGDAGLSGQEGQPSGGNEGQQGGAPSQIQADAAGAGAGDAPGGEGSDQGGGQQGGDVPTNNNPDGQGVGQFDPVYAPQRAGGEQGDQQIILEPDPGNLPVQEGEFSENPEGNVTVPYNQVFSDYSDAANRALESDYIPLGLRDVVRDYFSSLEPGQSNNGNGSNRP